MAKEYQAPPPGTLKIVLTEDAVYGYMRAWNEFAYKHSDWRMALVAEWFPHFCKVYEVYALDESMKERGLTLDSLFEGVKICKLEDIAEWCTTQDYVIAF
jgi:sulfur relay (sulfurtransferase) complex TusBCD TusD component (DsrE family)